MWWPICSLSQWWIGEPSSRISPTLGRARPTISRHSVLLPAPDGPMMASASPGSTAQDTSLMMSLAVFGVR